MKKFLIVLLSIVLLSVPLVAHAQNSSLSPGCQFVGNGGWDNPSFGAGHYVFTDENTFFAGEAIIATLEDHDGDPGKSYTEASLSFANTDPIVDPIWIEAEVNDGMPLSLVINDIQADGTYRVIVLVGIPLTGKAIPDFALTVTCEAKDELLIRTQVQTVCNGDNWAALGFANKGACIRSVIDH